MQLLYQGSLLHGIERTLLMSGQGGEQSGLFGYVPNKGQNRVLTQSAQGLDPAITVNEYEPGVIRHKDHRCGLSVLLQGLHRLDDGFFLSDPGVGILLINEVQIDFFRGHESELTQPQSINRYCPLFANMGALLISSCDMVTFINFASIFANISPRGSRA